MNTLSLELHVIIWHYLEEGDQKDLGSCCRHWYQEIYRAYIRTLHVHMWNWASEERLIELIRIIPIVIKNPSLQLSISASEGIEAELLCQLFRALNNSWNSLCCPLKTIHQCMLLMSNPELHIKRFTDTGLSLLVGAGESDFDSSLLFKLMKSTEKLSILGPLTPISVVPGIKEFSMSISVLNDPFQPGSCFAGLQKLFLFHCEIVDVSMFGSIPELSLEECGMITDITALNDNRRITISNCHGIRDYSQSFQNSERIEISLQWSNPPLVSFHRCRKVKSLKVTVLMPFMVRRSRIHREYDFIESDASNRYFAIGSLPELRELTLNGHDEITSLEHLGLGRLVVVELINLRQLSSLVGLGSGRNQKVRLRSCPLITDYSFLRHVHEVVIETSGQVLLSQLDHVRRLSIDASELIVDPSRPYDQINELIILGETSFRNLNELRPIPSLAVGCQNPSLLRFLRQGGKICNQKFVVVFSGCSHETGWSQAESMYYQYLAEYYARYRKDSHLVMLRK